MKNKLINVISKIKSKGKKMAPGLMSATIISATVLGQTAFAVDTTVFTTIVKALGGIAIAGAAVTAVVGLVSYGEAQSEGEGPELSKAKKQIKGAVVLAIVGIALSAGASTIGGTIKDITF